MKFSQQKEGAAWRFKDKIPFTFCVDIVYIPVSFGALHNLCPCKMDSLKEAAR